MTPIKKEVTEISSPESQKLKLVRNLLPPIKKDVRAHETSQVRTKPIAGHINK